LRKVILNLAVSLDGFIEGPNGEFDWCFTDQDYGMKAFMKRIDAVFMGRKSYEVVKKMGGENPYPKLKNYVFSRTLNHVDAGSILVNGDLEQEVKAIMHQRGKDIWLFGGASLVTSFVNANLVDELWLAVHPLLLGGALSGNSRSDPIYIERNESLFNRPGPVVLRKEVNPPWYSGYSDFHSFAATNLSSIDRDKPFFARVPKNRSRL